MGPRVELRALRAVPRPRPRDAPRRPGQHRRRPLRSTSRSSRRPSSSGLPLLDDPDDPSQPVGRGVGFRRTSSTGGAGTRPSRTSTARGSGRTSSSSRDTLVDRVVLDGERATGVVITAADERDRGRHRRARGGRLLHARDPAPERYRPGGGARVASAIPALATLPVGDELLDHHGTGIQLGDDDCALRELTGDHVATHRAASSVPHALVKAASSGCAPGSWDLHLISVDERGRRRPARTRRAWASSTSSRARPAASASLARPRRAPGGRAGVPAATRPTSTTIVEGLELARSLAAQPPLDPAPRPARRRRARSRSAPTLAGPSGNYFHPAGTCGIGRVVDTDGRVLGVDGAHRGGRVGDAHHPAREHERDDGRDRGADLRDDLTIPLRVPPAARRASSEPMTYSIVARDPEAGELGVAVQSRAFSTGAACAWALRRCRRRRDAVVHRAPLRPATGCRSCGRRAEPGAALLTAAGRGRPARGAAGRIRRPQGKNVGAHGCRVHPACGRLSGRGVLRPGEHAALGRGVAGDGRGVHRDSRNARRASARGARRRRRRRAATFADARRQAWSSSPPNWAARRTNVSSTSGSTTTASRSTSSGASTGWPPATGAGTGSRRAPIPTEELAAAREAGLPEHEVRTAEMFAYARNGDLERVRSLDGRGHGGGAALACCLRAIREAGPDPRGRRCRPTGDRIDAWPPLLSTSPGTPRPTR